MEEFRQALQAARDELSKAEYKGQKGKFRRVGKDTVFIRSDDKKCVKGPSKLRGRRLMMKDAPVSVGGMVEDFGSPSAEVHLTDTKRRKRKGSNDVDVMVKSIHDKIDSLSEFFQSLQAPELEENVDELLEKCAGMSHSRIIKEKRGVWRRVAGRPCFICDEGMIHAGPKNFLGKKVKTLADELRAERAQAKS